MFYFVTIPLALTPSLVWLFYYLKKDVHPEPNRFVIRVFLWGMTITVLVAIGIMIYTKIDQDLLKNGFNILDHLPYLFSVPIFIIFLNAFWEEGLKYLIVRFTVLKNPEFDEPVDAMEYMIIVALAFAAVENILIAITHSDIQSLSAILFVRFLGATLIHALSSAVLGFFLARAIFWRKNRHRFPLRLGFVWLGLIIATGLHGLFNFLIIESDNLQKEGFLYLIAILLIILSFVVMRGLRRLNLQSLIKKR